MDDKPLQVAEQAPAYYAKVHSRKALRELPFVEKVRLVVEMQKRVAPIYAARGIVIRPWTDVP